MKKDYSPKNKPSKRYQTKIRKLEFDYPDYEAGGYCRGHKTRHADNQTLSQLVRTKEKREVRNQINQEIENEKI